MKIKELKKGEYFTIKKIEYPTESQVWIRDEYDRSTRCYWAHKFNDINCNKLFKTTKEVFTDFYF